MSKLEVMFYFDLEKQKYIVVEPKKDKLNQFMRDPKNGQMVAAIFETWSENRTVQQNRYLHLVIRKFKDIMFELGHPLTEIEAKHFFKILTGFYTEIESKDGLVKVPKDSHKLSKKDFSEWLEVIKAYFRDKLGEEIPVPYWND